MCRNLGCSGGHGWRGLGGQRAELLFKNLYGHIPTEKGGETVAFGVGVEVQVFGDAEDFEADVASVYLFAALVTLHVYPPCEAIKTISAANPKAQIKLRITRSSHLAIGTSCLVFNEQGG